MYCNNCGRPVDDNSTYCSNCGARLNPMHEQSYIEDKPCFGFALLGFFIPLIGLILFLIYEGKKPKRAKSAGIGALIGFITEIILSILLAVLYVVFSVSLFNNISSDNGSNTPIMSSILNEPDTDEILENYVNISFGDFEVTSNGYYPKTSLNVTVKNIADKQYTYYITIEAVDTNGARLETDMIYADRLNAGQEIHLKAFEYVEQEKLEQFKSATFKVLEINTYDY